MLLTSIDPGVRALGWAAWFRARLVACGVSRNYEPDLATAARVHRAEIERWLFDLYPEHARPIVDETALESMEWRHGDVRSQPSDLLAVQTVGCLTACELGGFVRLIPPSRWKGTIPKNIHHERIRKSLDGAERAVLQQACERSPKGNHKEILDAVGIGLFHLKRTNRSGGNRV